jgi:hypothetical protein
VLAAVILGLATLLLTLHPWGSHKSPPVAVQVSAIERTEHETRDGSLQSVQPLALHGDGTQSWVFVFAERSTWRLFIYDNDDGRLRKGIEVTNRFRARPIPANFRFEGVPYRNLSPAKKRLARQGWFGLYTPHPMFDTPSAIKIADGTSVLLVPTSALTPEPLGPNSVRATLVAVFWSADQGRYILHRLDPVRERWTVHVPTPLRLQLQPGAGFQTLPTATEVTIDKRAHVVFATVGYVLLQVHAFRLPLSPDDLEECPAIWQGAAPIGVKKDVPRLERELSAGCPHV